MDVEWSLEVVPAILSANTGRCVADHIQRHRAASVGELIHMAQTGMTKVRIRSTDDRNMSESARTVVVVSNHGSLLERLVTDAGFDVVGQAEFAVNGEHLASHYKPDVVVVENELVGITGVDAMDNLHAASPASQFVLIVADDWTPSNRGDVGAFSVLTRSRLSELESELGALDAWLSEQDELMSGDGDRRRGRDRRVEQDWSKVGWERRIGPRRT